MAARDLKSQTLGLKKSLSSTANLAKGLSKEKVAKTNVENLPAEVKNSIVYIKDNQLLDDPMNVQYYGDIEVQGLVEIIKLRGFQGVILAYPSDGKYMIESGHRRRLAGRLAGLKEFPVYITEAPEHEWEKTLRLLGANDHDRKETPMMLARVADGYYKAHEKELKYKKDNGLLEPGATTSIIDLVAIDMEKDSASISRYRALLKLIPKLQKMADEETVSWSALAQAATLEKSYQTELYDAIQKKLQAEGKDSVKRAWIEGLIKKFRVYQQQGQKPQESVVVKADSASQGNLTKYRTTKSVLSQTGKFKTWIEEGVILPKHGEEQAVVQSLSELRDSLDKIIKEIENKKK